MRENYREMSKMRMCNFLVYEYMCYFGMLYVCFVNDDHFNASADAAAVAVSGTAYAECQLLILPLVFNVHSVVFIGFSDLSSS